MSDDRTTDTPPSPTPPPRCDVARSARSTTTRRRARPGWTVLAWVLTLLFFAPVAWMVLTSLHAESDAATNPPSIFAPLTFANYAAVFDRGVSSFLINSADGQHRLHAAACCCSRCRRRTRCPSSRWRSGRT